MTSLPFAQIDTPFADSACLKRAPAPNGAAFVLLLLMTPIVLIHPQEVWPSLGTVPLFQLLVLACLALSLPRVGAQCTAQSMAGRPIAVCVLGLFCAVVLSHLSHLSVWGARTSAVVIFKSVIYFLLLVGLVDSPSRLRQLLLCVVGCTLVLTTIALLHHYRIIEVQAITSSLEPDASAEELSRLRATGFYNDPNDLCLILVVASGICCYFASGWRRAPGRLLWLGPVAIFGFALSMTQSRGGLVSLIAGAAVFLWDRVGWRKGFLWGLLLGPLVFVIFSGRQTEISTEQETGQSRLSLWRDGLELFRESPIFGIGFGEFEDRVGMVAHNSYLHCFTELGLFGGVMFLAAFLYSIQNLLRRAVPAVANDATVKMSPDDQVWLARLRPYLAAIVVAYAVGMLSLSRAYVPPTYLILGICAVYLSLATECGHPADRFDMRFVRFAVAAGVVYLAAIHVFVRMFVDQGHG